MKNIILVISHYYLPHLTFVEWGFYLYHITPVQLQKRLKFTL
nr:MAG TPA: hypothetical protein [Caudoviricetes sp.]